MQGVFTLELEVHREVCSEKCLLCSENDTAYKGITTDRNVNGGSLCSAHTSGYVIINAIVLLVC